MDGTYIEQISFFFCFSLLGSGHKSHVTERRLYDVFVLDIMHGIAIDTSLCVREHNMPQLASRT